MNQHPVLTQINLAREHCKFENYDAALKCYQFAKDEVDKEIDNCKVRTEIATWNNLLKDIKAEEATIRRIKSALDDVLSKMVDPQPSDNSGEDSDEYASPQEDTEEAGPIRQLRAPDRRPVIGGSKPRRPAANQNPPRSAANQARFPRQGSKATNSNNNNNNNRNNNNRQNINPNAAKPPQGSNKGYDKPVLDPETNPLVQQIVDMGILVREPNVSWDSIAGLHDVKRLLRQNLVILPMRPDIAKGLLAPWKSVLFYGPPGTGKTFLAKAVATECKRTFFNVTSATITSRFHGESEKLVSHLFTLAQQMAPSTIFFDEIDSIASQRGTSNEGEASRRMKAQLLTALEGIDGASDDSRIFVLAATNFPWDLDEALLRRFQKRIYIPLPDEEGRAAIMKMTISDMIDDDFNIQQWAKQLEGYSCADITNLCRDAVQRVFDRQMEKIENTQAFLDMPAEEARVIITDADFLEAVKKRKSSVDAACLKHYDEWRKSKGAE